MRDAINVETIDEETETEEAAATNTVGRIAAPNRFEATSSEFYFWIKRGKTLEENQIVFSESNINGEEIKFYALIDEIKRTSRRADMNEEYDIGDGDVNYEPPFENEGFSYAHAQVLRTKPEISTPPIERSIVSLGGEEEAKIAYGFDDDDNGKRRWMPVGLLKNGRNFAGLGKIDLDYLLGENGGHLNVNGIAGVGTKTSFLLTVIKMLQAEADQSGNFFIAPIVFNVKGEDLMWLDRENSRCTDADKEEWKLLGVEPKPFENAQFFQPVGKPVSDCNASNYSWSFHDVLRGESLLYIFSDEDQLNANMEGLVRELIDRFTDKKDGKTPNGDAPKTWDELLQWFKNEANIINIYKSSWWAVYRRLSRVLEEGKDIFVRDKNNGEPLNVISETTSPPKVIDINSLAPSMQRFVVGTVLQQVVSARKSAKAVRNLCYVLMLDELNRFAPRGAKDEITRLLERVATEMRSQGVILLGAQQMASQVSTKVIEMSSIRVLGRTGAAELTDKIWSFFSSEIREKARNLQASEKFVMQPTFRHPMLVKMPLNPWADKFDKVKVKDFGDKDI
ncbi:ATP-binding protein [soil metagenome]